MERHEVMQRLIELWHICMKQWTATQDETRRGPQTSERCHTLIKYITNTCFKTNWTFTCHQSSVFSHQKQCSNMNFILILWSYEVTSLFNNVCSVCTYSHVWLIESKYEKSNNRHKCACYSMSLNPWLGWTMKWNVNKALKSSDDHQH